MTHIQATTVPWAYNQPATQTVSLLPHPAKKEKPIMYCTWMERAAACKSFLTIRPLLNKTRQQKILHVGMQMCVSSGMCACVCMHIVEHLYNSLIRSLLKVSKHFQVERERSNNMHLNADWKCFWSSFLVHNRSKALYFFLAMHAICHLQYSAVCHLHTS